MGAPEAFESAGAAAIRGLHSVTMVVRDKVGTLDLMTSLLGYEVMDEWENRIRVGVNGIPIIEDMVDDPGETKDSSTTRPVERRMLTDNMSMFLALRTLWKKSVWGVTTNVTAAGATALDEVSREVGR